MGFDESGIPPETWEEFRQLGNDLIETSPIRVYSASYKVSPYPYILNNVDEANNNRARRSRSFILDSKIGDEDAGNREVIQKAVKMAEAGNQADYLVPADVLHDPEATTDRVREFLEMWEPLYQEGTLTGRPIIPLQPTSHKRNGTLVVHPNHHEHFEELYSKIEPWVDRHNLDYWMLGGVAKAGPDTQIEAVANAREKIPEWVRLHGLGMGASIRVVKYLRNQTPVESVDFSTTSQNVRFGNIINKHLQKREFTYLTGEFASFVNGMIEYTQLLQIVMALSPVCNDNLLVEHSREPQDWRDENQAGLEEW